MLNKKGLFVLSLGVVSWFNQASPVTPSDKIWQDSDGNLYYQQPVKQVTTVDDAPISIRVFESMPYVRIVKANGRYELIPLSKSEFNSMSAKLDVIGTRLRSDFDGDGLPDILLQTDLGDELLISNKTVRPFKIGVNLRSLGDQVTLRDVNYDFRTDIVNQKTQKVNYTQSTGLTHTIDSSDYVGALSAESNVTPSGEFTYNIPITLGEATGGLKPSVSLSYSSSPQNGYVGVGFNIGGLSRISRCEKNMETDGVAGSVNLNTDDRFCLDGQRLIIKSGQSYGANSTEYRTRQNSGQRIVAHTSNSAQGPYAFTVTDTQGNKYIYGKYSTTQDALIKASNGVGFTWALKRVEDVSGNFYFYNYSKVSGSLEHYPISIKYSGQGTTTHNEVRFNWESRTDTRRVTYLKGNKITLTKRLKNIESYYSNELIRRYNLTYGYIGTGVTESVLQKVNACSVDGKCLSPTVFNWTNRGSVRLGRDIGTDYSRNSRYKAHQFLDFNGDGLTDIAYVRNDRGSSTDHLYMIPNTGSGFGQEKRFDNFASKSFRKTWKVVDYDKDGKDDILFIETFNKKWRVLKHTSGLNFVNESLSHISTPSSDSNSRFFDIDADGYPELLHFVDNKLSYQKGTKTGLVSGAAKQIKFNLSAPSGSSATMLEYDKEDNTFQAMDFNGDGRADFLAKVQISTYVEPLPCGGRFPCDQNPLRVNLQEPSSDLTVEPNLLKQFSAENNSSGALVPVDKSSLNEVDVSAGSTTELSTTYSLESTQTTRAITPSSYSRTSYWKVLVSKGLNSNGDFEFDEFLTISNTSSVKNIQATELNGDGLADILYQDNNNKWYARINNGNGFNNAIFLFEYNKASLKTADINGDGIQDIYREYYGDHFHFYNGTGFTAVKLTTNESDYNFTSYMDVTGDGSPDKLKFSGRMSLFQNSDSPATLISTVTDGFGAKTHITYSTLNNRNIYVPHNDARTKSWGNGRVTDMKSGARVVSVLRKGGDQLSYKYHGAKAQIGRGILGFRQIEIESKNSGSKVITTYRQDGDYRGSAERIQSYVRYGEDASDSGSGGSPTPYPDPCEIDESFCNCNWEEVCQHPRALPIDGLEPFSMSISNGQAVSLRSSSVASFSNVATMTTASVNSSMWRLKSEVTNVYGRKQETSFVTANSTKPYMVYPSRTVTKNFNADDANQTVIATKTKTLTIDSYGNPISEASTVDSANGYAHTSSTNSYSYTNYGGRLTRKVESKRYLNRLSGSNKTNYINSHTSQFAYDGLGRLIKTTADNGVVKTYTLNSYGLITKETITKAGLPTKVLETFYDSTYRHVTGEKNNLGHRSTIAYDSKGRKNYVQTANGQRTYYTYNKLGRLTVEISTPANNTSITGSQAITSSKTKLWCANATHCPSGAVYYEESFQEGAPISRSYFDVFGRTLREGSVALNGTYVYIDYQYDIKGRKTKESMPYFANSTISWNTYKYDKQNRAIEVTKADGSVWQTQYAGESVTNINPAGHENTQVKNAMGLLVKVIDATGKTATYQYDENGKSRILIGPKGNQIKVIFDKYGNKTQVVDPDKGTVNYTYNAYHQLIQETDSNGNLVTYKYDILGRLLESERKRNNKLEHHTINTYDGGSYAKGMLYTTTDKVTGFTERFYYDAFGRNREKHTIIDGDTYKELWAYNKNGQLLTETDATGKSISYIYNSYNHLSAIKDNQTNTTVWQAKSTDAFGNTTKEQLGSSITRNKVFDAHTGLLTSMISTGSGTLQNLRYDWNNLGNLNYRQDLAVNKKETFGYDSLNRVTRSTISGVATTDIRYNELGNITYKTGVGTYLYQSSRPHAVTQVTGARPNSYQYDAAGNMVKDNDRELAYNSFHKPTFIKKDDYWVEFTYSNTGKRYKRSEFGGEKGSLIPILNGDITVFIPLAQETRYVGNVEFIRYGGQSTWVSKRYIADKVLITTINNQATTRYMLDDHLGSTHVIADASGKLEQSMSFDVFGARRDAKTWARDFSDQAKFTSKITLRGFTGHEQMDEVGLVHMGGRIYDPILGRFLQADPMVQAPENIQNLNRYSYVMNNPLNKTDPSGYIFVTLAVFALNALATGALAGTIAGAVISGILTAYEYYGYAKLAIGIAQAIDGGGTAMANFAGGYAKSWAKGEAIGLLITGMTAAVNSVGKEQGSGNTDSHQSKHSSERNDSSEDNTFVKSNREALTKEIGSINEKREARLKEGLFDTHESAAKWLNENAGHLQDKYGAEVGANIGKIYGSKKGWAIGEVVTSEHSTKVDLGPSIIPKGGAYYDATAISDNADWHTHSSGSHYASKGVGKDSHKMWKIGYVSSVGSDGKAHMSVWDAPSVAWPLQPKDYNTYQSCIVGTCK